MSLTRTVEPADLISLTDAKTHLNVDFADQDALITSLIAVATDVLDGPTGEVGKALVTQTWQWRGARPDGSFTIPLGPVQSITSIKYYDTDNVQQTLTVTDYPLFDGNLKPLRGVTWPTAYDRPDAYEITFVAGYGAPSDVPPGIIQAALLLVGHYFETREDTTDVSRMTIPRSARDLLSRHKTGWIGG